MNQDRLEQLLAFYAQDPEDAFTRFALAQEYLQRSETAQAMAFMEALVADEPAYTGTYYHLGKLYEATGRTADAVAIYRRGIDAARTQRQQKDLSELQAALLNVQGLGDEA